jgi:hypothetical protein
MIRRSVGLWLVRLAEIVCGAPVAVLPRPRADFTLVIEGGDFLNLANPKVEQSLREALESLPKRKGRS